MKHKSPAQRAAEPTYVTRPILRILMHNLVVAFALASGVAMLAMLVDVVVHPSPGAVVSLFGLVLTHAPYVMGAVFFAVTLPTIGQINGARWHE